ncbi:MAG: hypothetical protein ACAH95_01785 [Fimbriimonas sp.]
MVFAALLLPLYPVSQEIDFSSRASGLGEVVARLAEQTGASLKAAPAVAQEIVFVRVRGVSLAELKSKLAEAADAEWVKSGGMEYLSRTAKQEREIWKRHVSLRRGYLDEELKRIRKELEQPFDAKGLATKLSKLPRREEAVTPAAARDRYLAEAALFAQAPSARLMNRLLLACNPDDLAAVGPYERAVFRFAPTPMQRGFVGTRLKEALDLFEKEQQDWQEAAQVANFPEEVNSRMVSDPRAQVGMRASRDIVSGLDIVRGDGANLFSVNLIGLHELFGGYTVLCHGMLADPTRRFLNESTASKTGDDPIVKLSADTDTFTKTLVSTMGGASTSVSPRMRELLLNPEQFDPLSFLVSDLLEAYATFKNANVVASIPDSAFGGLYFAVRETPLTLRAGMRALQDGGLVSLRERGNWAVLMPADRLESAMLFTPRKPMGSLMRSIQASGRLDMRAYTSYAFQTGRISRVGMGENYLMLYDRSIGGTLDQTDWDGLRLYGSFNSQQQRALDEGTRFAMQGLSAAQKGIVKRLAYKALIRSEVQQGGGVSSAQGLPVEPTDVFADGLPTAGTVIAKTKVLPVLVAYGKTNEGKTRPLRNIDPFTLATVETTIVGDPEKMASYGVTGLVGYAPGVNRHVALRVEFAPGIWREIVFTVPEYDPNAAPVPWEKLPEDWVKKVWAAHEQLKAQKAGQGRRVIPPEVG